MMQFPRKAPRFAITNVHGWPNQTYPASQGVLELVREQEQEKGSAISIRDKLYLPYGDRDVMHPWAIPRA
jgi:hypothetical protein